MRPASYPGFFLPFLEVIRRPDNDWRLTIKCYGGTEIRKSFKVQIKVYSTNPEIFLSFSTLTEASPYDATDEEIMKSSRLMQLTRNQARNLKFANEHFGYQIIIRENMKHTIKMLK